MKLTAVLLSIISIIIAITALVADRTQRGRVDTLALVDIVDIKVITFGGEVDMSLTFDEPIEMELNYELDCNATTAVLSKTATEEVKLAFERPIGPNLNAYNKDNRHRTLVVSCGGTKDNRVFEIESIYDK